MESFTIFWEEETIWIFVYYLHKCVLVLSKVTIALEELKILFWKKTVKIKYFQYSDDFNKIRISFSRSFIKINYIFDSYHPSENS